MPKCGSEAPYQEVFWDKLNEWCVESDVVPLLFCLPAGQHRSLGTMVSKVQSLKLDTSVWSNEIVQVRVAVSFFFTGLSVKRSLCSSYQQCRS